MNKFLFKSTNADFQKLFQLLESKLDILQKNVLYCTHMDDKILKLLNSMIVDDNAQKQVDDFYQTSPQTDPGEQNGPRSSN